MCSSDLLSVAGRSETESESIANQEYCIRRFVDEQPDIEIVSCRIDDGYSGLIFQRPSFCAMLQDATEGKINCIIVRDLSRFGREFVETGRYLRNILPAYGIRFIAISDGLDTNRISAKDDLLMQIKSAINDEFSRDISMKTRRALSTMRKNGLYIGASPVYGYLKSNEDRHQLVIDEYAANIVRDIFDMKISGASAVVIAKELNDRNILSPLEYKKSKGLPYTKNGFAGRSNSRWSASTIIRILKDETYIGTLVQGKQYSINYKVKKQVTKPIEEWVRIEGVHEAIVPYYDFQTVRRLMLLDTRISPGCDRLDLFSGLLICGSCGNTMVRKTVTHNGKQYVYYQCTTNRCDSPVSIRADTLENIVVRKMRDYINKTVELTAGFRGMCAEEIQDELTKRVNEQLQLHREKLEQTSLLKSSLVFSLTKGVLSEEEYQWMKNSYSDSMSELEKEIENLLLRKCQEIAHVNDRVMWLDKICSQPTNVVLNRRILATLICGIYISDSCDVKTRFFFNWY